jgi:hypothetical protein
MGFHDRSDIDTCYICGDDWRCDICFDPAREVNCSNCWNTACISCLILGATAKHLAKYQTPIEATKAFMRRLLEVYEDVRPAKSPDSQESGSISDSEVASDYHPSDDDDDNDDPSDDDDDNDDTSDDDDDDDTASDEDSGNDSDAGSYTGEEEDDDSDSLPDMEGVLGSWLLLRQRLERSSDERAVMRELIDMFSAQIWRGVLMILDGQRKCTACAQHYLCKDCLENEEVKKCRACHRPRLFFTSKDFEYEGEYSDDEADAKLEEGEAKQLREHVLGV